MPGRKKISSMDIQNQLDLNLHPAEIPGDRLNYQACLHRSLAMPSYVHGYSLAIEYMKSWFIKKFGKDFFKVVHVNGKHVLDDWKHFNNYNIKREKPMLAIVPSVDYDYDRETLDLYMADQDMYLRRSKYQQAFLKDYKNDLYLGLQMRAMRMNFGFKVRVNSRAEQQWVYNHMEIWFRIGATQTNDVSADFHVPYDVMMNIAYDVGFEVDPKTKRIKNITEFIGYLNAHSDLPFVFKMRAINQKPEFFIRVRDMPVHINTTSKLRLDDGERVGRLDTNFHVEMEAVLTIPIPHFYVYFSKKPIHETIMVTDRPGVGVYSINAYEIPPENRLGWDQFVQTSYLCEKDETVIDLSELFEGNGNVKDVLNYSLEQHINPKNFLEVVALRTEDVALMIPYHIDYTKMRIILEKPLNQEEMINIVIYVDKRYINETKIVLENYQNSRIEPQDKTEH